MIPPFLIYFCHFLSYYVVGNHWFCLQWMSIGHQGGPEYSSWKVPFWASMGRSLMKKGYNELIPFSYRYLTVKNNISAFYEWFCLNSTSVKWQISKNQLQITRSTWSRVVLNEKLDLVFFDLAKNFVRFLKTAT